MIESKPKGQQLQTESGDLHSATTLSAKKPYEAPAIEETAPFETLALSCAKQEEVSQCSEGGPFFNS